MRVLLIEDDSAVAQSIELMLKSESFNVYTTDLGEEGVDLGKLYDYDIILLDLGLPDRSGHEVLKHLRDWCTKPILIISVQSDEQAIVKALDSGANDYVTKPFRTGELLARVRSALRNSGSDAGKKEIVFADFSIDLVSRSVKKRGHPIKLTSTEYSLLSLLARNEGKVLTHHYLLTQIWGQHYHEQSQYLRVFIGQLRKKIEDDPNRPKFIVTESGVGYRFTAIYN